MKRIAIFCLAVIFILLSTTGMNCDNSGESRAIKDTIAGYLTAYNDGDFDNCLTYITGIVDEQEARNSLSLINEHLGDITLQSFFIHNINDADDECKANLQCEFWGATSNILIDFQKEAGEWKLVWGQPLAPGTVNRAVPVTVEMRPSLNGKCEVKQVAFEVTDNEYTAIWLAYQARNTADEKLPLGYTAIPYEENDSIIADWGNYINPQLPGSIYQTITMYDGVLADEVSYIELTVCESDVIT